MPLQGLHNIARLLDQFGQSQHAIGFVETVEVRYRHQVVRFTVQKLRKAVGSGRDRSRRSPSLPLRVHHKHRTRVQQARASGTGLPIGGVACMP